MYGVSLRNAKNNAEIYGKTSALFSSSDAAKPYAKRLTFLLTVYLFIFVD
ncbi:MAG: hypothetical protein LBS69_09345 [Prevotellaceae bacterium]|nr:hypothetical protein [Prevotellaceae bacterium]